MVPRKAKILLWLWRHWHVTDTSLKRWRYITDVNDIRLMSITDVNYIRRFVMLPHLREMPGSRSNWYSVLLKIFYPSWSNGFGFTIMGKRWFLGKCPTLASKIRKLCLTMYFALIFVFLVSSYITRPYSKRVMTHMKISLFGPSERLYRLLPLHHVLRPEKAYFRP